MAELRFLGNKQVRRRRRSSSSGAGLITPVGGGTPTVVSVSSASFAEGADIVLTVTLSNATIADTVYSYDIAGANGLGNADIAGTLSAVTFSNGVTKITGTTSGNLTVPTGVSSFTATWSTVDDALYELNERLSFTVAGINGQGTITDNDTVPVVSLVSNQTTSEGNTMTFSVSISAAAGRTVSVNYATSDNTALAGSDYTAASGTLTWEPLDATNKTFTVAILADAVTPETGEYFTVTLSTPSACTIGTGTATGTITNVAPPTVSTVSSQSANEGTNMVFTVMLTGVTTVATPFSYALSGTASAPSDYNATPTFSHGVTESGGTLSVPSGVTSFTATYSTVVNGDVAETVILTVDGVSGTATIIDLGSVNYGDSLSTFALATNPIITSVATDTLNIADGLAGGYVTIKPIASGTGVKTVHKVGSANSEVYSKSRLGYVRLNSATGDHVKIGNGDLILPQRHAFGILCRMPQSQITGFAGSIILAKTSQLGLTGNPLMTLGVDGSASTAHTSSARNYPFCDREGFTAGASATKYEVSATYNGVYNTYADLYGKNGVTAGDNKWCWVWVMGTDSTVEAVDALKSFNHSDDATGNRTLNTIRLAHALHGCQPKQEDISSRWSLSPVFLTSAGGTGIFPEKFDNSDANHPLIDFVLGVSTSGTKQLDVARVIKLSTFPGLDNIAAMSSGRHPKALGLMSGDDFCIDFNGTSAATSSAICTDQGTPTYQPAADGPVAVRYHGTDVSDVVLNISNQRIT